MRGPGDDDGASELATDAPGTDENTTLPWPLLLRSRLTSRVEQSDRYPWLVLATVLFGLFAVGCTITVLAVSVETIADDLGSDVSVVSWVTTGPILAFAVFGPAAGRLADLRGQRRVYLWSLGAATVFAALSAAAPSAGALLAARVLGAATGAATGPASLAIINRLFPPELRPKAMGYWAMVGAGGPVIGALVGAPVVETFGWRWLFVGQVPLTLATVLVAAAVIPDLPPAAENRGARFDLAGAVTLGGGCVSLLLAVNRGSVLGWSHPLVVAGFLLSPLLLATFVAVERRVAHPLLPMAYVRRGNFTYPILTQLFTNFAYMGAFLVTPLLLQDDFGYGQTQAALISIPRPLVFAVAGPIAGALTLRIGERTSGMAGALSIAASMVALAALDPGDGAVWVVGALALSGLGMGTASPALAASIANAVEEADLGIAGATQQMVSQVGAAIGGQVMLAIHTAREASSGSVGAYGEAYLVGAVCAVIGMVLASRVRSTPRRAEGAPEGALEAAPA